MRRDGSVYDRLVAAGMSPENAAQVGTDLRDLREGLDSIEDLFAAYPADTDPTDKLVEIIEECDLHLKGHLRSLRQTAAKLCADLRAQ